MPIYKAFSMNVIPAASDLHQWFRTRLSIHDPVFRLRSAMNKCRKEAGVQQREALLVCEFLHVLLFPDVCLDFTYCPGKINCLHISENLIL